MPRHQGQIGWSLQSCRWEDSSLKQSSREGNVSGWILDDLLICYKFSAYLFTILFEYLFPGDRPRDPEGFSIGKKNMDIPWGRQCSTEKANSDSVASYYTDGQ